MTTRALIVDDHPVIRAALVSSLISMKVFDEVDTANCFKELLEKLERNADFDMLILDLSLTDISGSNGVAYIREHYETIPIMIFSGNDSADIIAECFEYGVHGFVSKTAPMSTFVNAIGIVLSGNIYIPPSAAQLMGFDPPEQKGYELEMTEERIHFTPKQQEVYEQLLLGVPNKIIAKRLDMAEGTVKTHLHGIYQLLRVNSRAQAILKSREILIV